MINSENYIKILEKNQKLISSYQIYCLYSLFNNEKKFYHLKYIFNKWKKNIQIFNDTESIKHIKNSKGHCIICECQDKMTPLSNCDYYQNINNSFSSCFNCKCKICTIKLKNVIIKNKYKKFINPKRYYFFLWFKNIFNKSGNIYN